MQYDIVLRNGTIIDGAGRPPYVADVAIQADRIARIGDVGPSGALRTVDVSGLVVAPGFIDVHSHDDAALVSSPEMACKLTQGVTTVIAGNCGISGAPYAAVGDPPDLLRLVFRSDRFVAPTFSEFVQKVVAAKPAINAGFLTGHTTLRMEVMGKDLGRPATGAEIRQMQKLLQQCLEAGALGFSTGLFYPPARAASTHEVTELAALLSSYEGVYATHMRDEADGVMESLKETLAVGRAIGSPVIISHHKCMGQKNFGRSVQTLSLLQEARQHQSLAWDVYPYTAGSSVLNAELVTKSSRTVLTWCDPHPELSGRDLSEVAREWECSIAELVPKLLPAGAVYFMMDEEDVVRIMRSPAAMFGSDGMPQDQHPHPRLWGTFPRVLGRYVRERNILTLPDAVHRMTGLSAERFGLHDRGRVEEGRCADLCIFDPETVLDVATYEQPTQPAVGIRYVFVNGQPALERGVFTGTRAGRVLLRNRQERI
jgi:N-acyl-D-amino-acid deacylase